MKPTSTHIAALAAGLALIAGTFAIMRRAKQGVQTAAEKKALKQDVMTWEHEGGNLLPTATATRSAAS